MRRRIEITAINLQSFRRKTADYYNRSTRQENFVNAKGSNLVDPML